MTIKIEELNNNPKVKVDTLTGGDAFLYGGDLYIVVVSGGREPVVGVRVSGDGGTYCTSFNTEVGVEPVDIAIKVIRKG